MAKRSESKVIKRRIGVDSERLKDVLSEMPNTDVIDSIPAADVLIPIETNPVEKVKRKPPVNKRAYTLEECTRIIEMINAGKSLDEIHQETKRPVLSLTYKFFNDKRGVRKCRDVEKLKEFFPEVN